MICPAKGEVGRQFPIHWQAVQPFAMRSRHNPASARAFRIRWFATRFRATRLALEAPNTPSSVSSEEIIWDLLHSKVITNAKTRFEAGHYADAVEAALKEVNTVVKELVRKKTGQELDGSSLMLKALSPNGPIIVLDDLSTENGKSIQEGYMHIFAGAMKGIRNPKAHANLEITKVRCVHLLFLASLLFHKLDERP